MTNRSLNSESMYKKRIQAWGLSKSSRAAQKDAALALLTKKQAGANKEGVRITVRHDKLIRYAQQRVKAGLLDPKVLSELQSYSASPITSGTAQDPLKRSYSPEADLLKTDFITSQQSPTDQLPDPLAKFDLFLRGMVFVFEKEQTEWTLLGRTRTPDSLVRTFNDGIDHWRAKDFTAARVSWTIAARDFLSDLQNPSGAVVSRMSYFVGALVWNEIHDPVFLKFRDFMISAAMENLGSQHPLTIMLDGLRIKQSVEAQLAVWDLALRTYKDSDVYHLYNMARGRWLFCKKAGLMDMAVWYREHAAGEMRKLGMMTVEMERQADEDLGVVPARMPVLP